MRTGRRLRVMLTSRVSRKNEVTPGEHTSIILLDVYVRVQGYKRTVQTEEWIVNQKFIHSRLIDT
jgi:hypothetical protein